MRNVGREIIFTSLVKRVAFQDNLNLMLDDSPFKEGEVVAVEVQDAVGYAVGGGLLTSSFIEDIYGGVRVLSPGARVVTVVGSRESTFWTVADLSARRDFKMQLVSLAGLCSHLVSGSTKTINVQVLGRVVDADDKPINIKDNSLSFTRAHRVERRKATVFVGTSAEVGKTTSLLHVLRRLRQSQPQVPILAIKLSGTPSEAEINMYRSYGATEVLNLVDLGFPSSYTSDKALLMNRVSEMIASIGFASAAHVLIELGGDVIGGTNEELLQLINKTVNANYVIAAFDCFGAESCTRFLRDRDIHAAALTGKCTANTVVKKRTQHLCSLPALSVFDADDLEELTRLCIEVGK